MDEPQASIYEFEGFRLDPFKRLLSKADDEIVPLMPKAFDTLLHLVRHAGEVVEKDALMGAVWADTIVEENNLNQNISVLRKVLGDRRGRHRFIVTVPGRGYKFVAGVRRMPPGELSFGADTSGAEPDPAKKRPVRVGPYAAAGLVLLLICLGALYYLRPAAPTRPPVRSIAVLPFKPLVPEHRNEILEMGMADTLIARLSGSPQMIVRPLNSVRRFGGLDEDPQAAGRALRVDSVLEGSIQRWGDKIRVNVRLIDVADGTSLWSGTFDERFTDIFRVQDAISERVAAALRVRLGRERGEKYRTRNIEAYQFYLRGRFHSLRLILPEVERGIGYYDRAIDADPGYAPAWAGKADAYRMLSLTSDFPSDETVPKARAAARRALELDGELPEAHAVLAWLEFFHGWNWVEAERIARQGLALAPNNADLHLVLAHLGSNTGDHGLALAEIKLARELDPLNLRINVLEGQFLFYAGRHEEALERIGRTLELDPDFWLAHLNLARIHHAKGRYREAAAAAARAREITRVNSESLALRGAALAADGRPAEARAVLAEMLAPPAGRHVPPYNVALLYHALGEKEKALDHLERGFAERDFRMVFLRIEPKWDGLRREPRFVELMKRMNF